MLKCTIIGGKMVELDILPDKRRDSLVRHVLRVCTGKIPIDYEMRGEWLQVTHRTIVEHELWEKHMKGLDVGVRDFKRKGRIDPPLAIVRLRKRNNNAVRRSCEELYKHGWITSYTILKNGHIHVNWFDGYIRIERDAFEKVTVEIMPAIPDRLSLKQEKLDYIRDRVTYSGSKVEAMRQKRGRNTLSKHIASVYGG